MEWLVVLGGSVIIFTTLIVVETQRFRAREQGEGEENVRLPSEILFDWMETFRRWGGFFGFWLARLLNPMYYCSLIIPYLEDYWHAIIRLCIACLPRRPPFYDFISGFFQEVYGHIDMLFYFVLAATMAWWYQINHLWLMEQFMLFKPWFVGISLTLVALLLYWFYYYSETIEQYWHSMEPVPSVRRRGRPRRNEF